MKKSLLVLLLVTLIFSTTACGSKKEEEANNVKPIAVKGQKVSDSLTWSRELSYPGTIVSESEAKILAKTAGTVSSFNVAIGAKVEPGQELGRIDDQAAGASGNFNAGQIKQAQIGVAQAQSAYQLAKTNYENLLASASKDLDSAAISRDQAATSENNLELTITEGLKSAELAYETAKIATQQAKDNLDIRQRQLTQGEADARANADIVADSAISTSGALLVGLNNILGFDDSGAVSVPYRSSLGALEINSHGKAEWDYDEAKKSYATYLESKFTDVATKMREAIKVTELAKQATDSAKYLLEKSIPSAALPQSAMSGPSLSAFQQQVAAFQSQANGALAQAKGAQQGLDNLGLNRQATMDALEKAYQIARQQEAAAAQNLNNLKAGNTSQRDQASFAADLAQNQYDNFKIKLSSQLAAARSQMEAARLQYENAQVALQSSFDVHSIISPISGTLTNKLVGNGDSVNPGQMVATVSQVDNLKVQFYVEAERIHEIYAGMAASITTTDGRSYTGVISSVAQQPDLMSRRFLAELSLEKYDGLVIGTIVDVKISVQTTVTLSSGLSLLPLSALNIGQAETKILVYDAGQVREQVVEVVGVLGEMAQVKTGLAHDDIIITSGNKLVGPGQAVSLSE